MYNEELHNLCASVYITRVIKQRKMRWMGHVARMGEMRNAYKILVGKPKRKRPLGRTKRKGRIILEWILGSMCGKLWTVLI
jgi:hypothetical protein